MIVRSWYGEQGDVASATAGRRGRGQPGKPAAAAAAGMSFLLDSLRRLAKGCELSYRAL